MRTSETQRAAGAQAGAYGELETFCLFIGYPKSGHSLVGALSIVRFRTVVLLSDKSLKSCR